MKNALRLFGLMGVATLLAFPALAGHGCGSGCMGDMAGVKKEVTNLNDGIKITMSATDPKVVSAIQEKAGTCDAKSCGDCPMHQEGIARQVTQTADGVTITATATDPELIKKLQEHGAQMTAGGMQGCGEHAKKMEPGCPHMKAEAGSDPVK